MIYFDNAATSRYKPNAVIDTLVNELKHSSNAGRGAHKDAIDLGYKIFQTRENIKNYFNATNYSVIFTKNCSEALNLAIIGSAKQGGHVITTCYQHNSVLRTLSHLEKTKNLQWDAVFFRDNLEKSAKILNEGKLKNSDVKIDVSDVEKLIKPNTYMLIVNHVSNVTGEEEDLEEYAYLCKKYSLKLLIDGAQSVGHKKIDLDKLNATFLCAPGHKGLMGVQGTGFLVVKNTEKLAPVSFGGTGTKSKNIVQPSSEFEDFEVGTLNSAGIVSLNEAINFSKQNFNEINGKIENLTKILKSYEFDKNVLVYSPIDTYNGIFTFNIKNMPSDVVSKILNEKYDIAQRAGFHCAPLVHKALNTYEYGSVRISIGYNNSISDVKQLIYAINQISKYN